MGSDKTVEFIPWIHSNLFRAHSQAMDYLKTLKKGTPVGIEFAPIVIEYLDRYTDRVVYNKKKPEAKSETIKFMEDFDIKYPESLGYTTGQIEALQLLAICRERGLSIRPLDTNYYQMKVINIDKKIYDAQQKKDFNLIKKYKQEKETFILSNFRNESIAKNIVNNLKTQDNLIVLFGAMHTLDLMELSTDDFNKTFNRKYNLIKKYNTNIFGADKNNIDYIVKYIGCKDVALQSIANDKLYNKLEKTKAEPNRLFKNYKEKANQQNSTTENRAVLKRSERKIKDSNLSNPEKSKQIKQLRKAYIKINQKMEPKKAKYKIERLYSRLK